MPSISYSIYTFINIVRNLTTNYNNNACNFGKAAAVKMIMENEEIFKIDLTAKTNEGKTGFQLAVMKGNQDVINLIETTMPSIAIF